MCHPHLGDLGRVGCASVSPSMKSTGSRTSWWLWRLSNMCKVLAMFWHINSALKCHLVLSVSQYNKVPTDVFLLCFLDVRELKECLSVLVREQHALAMQSAASTLSALRLKQRLAILERYFIALNRTVFQENVKVKWKSSSISLPPVDKKR